MRFDVLVVGGGTAGCVLAARLSEDPGRSVCLVEAGPDYGPYTDGRWPEDKLDARRARILGGCSAHNACAVLEGAPAAPCVRRGRAGGDPLSVNTVGTVRWNAAFA